MDTTTSPSTTEAESLPSSSTPLAAAVEEPVTPAVEPVEKAPEVEPAAVEPEKVTPIVDPAEDYEIEVGEDSNMSQADLDAIAAIASEQGLNKEQADALVAERESVLSQGMKIVNDAIAAKHATQVAAFNADLDFVGENKAGTFASITSS